MLRDTIYCFDEVEGNQLRLYFVDLTDGERHHLRCLANIKSDFTNMLMQIADLNLDFVQNFLIHSAVQCNLSKQK